MARHHDASKERRWLDLVLLWKKSKLTVREFCQCRQLSEPSFYSWRRVLRQRGLIQDWSAASPTPKSAKSPAPKPSHCSAVAKLPAFVNLTVVAEPSAAAEPVTPNAIDLVLSERRLLRVRPGFDSATLLQLVRLLEKEPPC
jgi:transposase